MHTKVLTTIQEMLSQIDTIKFLYQNMTIEKHESFLIDMIPKNYKQVALFEDEICIGMTGFGSALNYGRENT